MRFAPQLFADSLLKRLIMVIIRPVQVFIFALISIVPMILCAEEDLRRDFQGMLASGDGLPTRIPNKRLIEDDDFKCVSLTTANWNRALSGLASVANDLLHVAVANFLQVANSDTDYGKAIEKLKAAVEFEVASKKLPAFSIALVDSEQVVWADGFGFQDPDQKIPATAQSVYRVGSVSKLFTDIAVMQLVEKERVDLDVPIQRYVPSFQPENPYGIDITLRQLMAHRSGLVRESPVGNYFDPTEPTLAATVASLNRTQLVYRPDTKTKYSNAAIAVVGTVLENLLEVSHPQQVKSMIFDPLGMTDSSFLVTQSIRPKMVTGWMRTYDGRRFEAPNFRLGTGPAGNLYSSVLDLSKFLSCLFRDGKTSQGQILQEATLQQMYRPIEDAEGNPQGFGIGFHVQELDGYLQVGHGGAVYGFSTQLEALPERRIGIAAAAALDGSNGVVRRLGDYALRLMLATQDQKPLPDYRMTRQIPGERISELVGTYRGLSDDERIHIEALNGELFLYGGALRRELRAAEDDGTILTDDPEDFGTQVTLELGNRLTVGSAVFERLADTPPDDIPDRWKGLIGEYGWDHNVLYLLEDAGQLYALIEWFYYYPLTEMDENTFSFPDYGLYHGEELKVHRDADGLVTHVVAADVKFERRELGSRDGVTFQITPLKPIDQLRSSALSAIPPAETGTFRGSELVDVRGFDGTIELDIRYATTNNFTGEVFYRQPRAFMQRPAAEALARVNARLKDWQLGLLVHDAYRPWHVTKMFWDATPDHLKDFVANPANGSRHNRGCAVDLTLYDLATGHPIQMVAGYDEFSPRSFPLYPGGTSRQRWYRGLLRRTMEAESFSVYEYEWWHFDYRDWQSYRIGNSTFEEME